MDNDHSAQLNVMGVPGGYKDVEQRHQLGDDSTKLGLAGERNGFHYAPSQIRFSPKLAMVLSTAIMSAGVTSHLLAPRGLVIAAILPAPRW